MQGDINKNIIKYGFIYLLQPGEFCTNFHILLKSYIMPNHVCFSVPLLDD